MNRQEHIISTVILAAVLLHLTSYSVHSARDFIIDGLNRNVCGNTTYTGWTSTNAFCDTGLPDVKERISGGSNAEPGRFPSFVQLVIRNSTGGGMGCGGTLIHSNLILTAAHCMAFPGIRSVTIIAGCLNPSNPLEKPLCQFEFGKVFCSHPQFNPNVEEGGGGNDIALLQTYKPLKYNDKVQPACLQLKKQPGQDTECYAVGRGMVSYGESNDEVKYLAMKRGCQMPANVKQKDLDQYKSYSRFFNTSTCYMSASKRGNACQGDSGGPMYCMDRCGPQGLKQYVVGATSFGNDVNRTVCSVEKYVDYTFYADPTKMRVMLEFMLKHCHDP